MTMTPELVKDLEHRIQQLLECNNRELEKRRSSELRTAELETNIKLLQSELLTMVRALGDLLTCVRDAADEHSLDEVGEPVHWQSPGLVNSIDAGNAVMKKYCKERGI